MDNNNNLNIITLNIPYPPDYGGMIDSFYRIKSLQSIGVRIHLHCFEYGRQRSQELKELCETVNYYQRTSGLFRFFSIIPYIINTRRSERMLDSLLSNDYPILFDGLHTTFFLNHPSLEKRKKYLRTHNIEYRYYRNLATNESNLIKKLYYLSESFKLKKFEDSLPSDCFILPISAKDQVYFNSKNLSSIHLAPFHPFNKSESISGTGEYILFHGDLSVNENSIVADNLIKNVFSQVSYLCIIAGKNPPGFIKAHAAAYQNIEIVSNPEIWEMNSLIKNAHINLLPALEGNGFKLKLLYSLYEGKHCLVNSVMAGVFQADCLLHIADSNKEFVEKINCLMQVNFTQEMIHERMKVLSEYYCNQKNSIQLNGIIFNK